MISTNYHTPSPPNQIHQPADAIEPPMPTTSTGSSDSYEIRLAIKQATTSQDHRYSAIHGHFVNHDLTVYRSSDLYLAGL
jgi:hypothetical protein